MALNRVIEFAKFILPDCVARRRGNGYYQCPDYGLSFVWP